MKLKDLLTHMYEQNPIDIRDTERALRYAYRYLTYLNEYNVLLKTDDVVYFGEERENELSGDEIVENGFYTLWSGAHDGVEWLQRHDTYEDALNIQNEWNSIQFNPYDFCAILEVM